MNSLQLLSKSIPNPFIIPQVEVKFIVSSIQASSSYQNSFNYTDISSQFTNHKDLMLRDLSNQHQIPINELENIYLEFCRVSRGRRIDGKINRMEFGEIMGKKMNRYELIEDFFNGIDECKTGVIDFRNFVAALGILRNSYMEGKLFLVFNAYSLTEYRVLNKADLFRLLEINDKEKSYIELSHLVGIVFANFDVDRDEKLSFAEFKNAYNGGLIKLDLFWTSFSLINFDEQLVPCIQCAKKIHARDLRGIHGKCNECSVFMPSPGRYLYS